MEKKKSLRKVGLDFGVISGAEWLIIIAAFLVRYLLQFYQTSIRSSYKILFYTTKNIYYLIIQISWRCL
ncbi:MAG: hypothetical protein RXN81_05485 [Caldisphaera sp.]